MKFRITHNESPKAPNEVPPPAHESALPGVVIKSYKQLHLLPSRLRRNVFVCFNQLEETEGRDHNLKEAILIARKTSNARLFYLTVVSTDTKAQQPRNLLFLLLQPSTYLF